MDLSLSEDQRLIAESAAEFLAEASDSRAMRAAADSADGFDRALWARLVELGWCGVQADEAEGGLGLGWVEQALLQEQMGRRMAPVPHFESVVCCATLLRELGHGVAAVPALAALRQRLERGEAVAAWAVPGGPWLGAGGDAPAARVYAQGEGLRLDGRWPQVAAAPQAQMLLLPARDESDEWVLLAVPADATGLRCLPLDTVDRTRRCADVQADAVVLPADAALARGPGLAAAVRRTLDLAAIALAAAQVGTAQQCLDLSLAYAAQRVQFGQPIAVFQAVKHRCAQMAVALEGARSAVYGAAAVADAAGSQDDGRRLAFHAAQARCEATEAAQFCAQEAIQLHGGVGFTWEYDPQLYFKRAQADSQRLGPLSWWRERVAAQWLDDASGPLT